MPNKRRKRKQVRKWFEVVFRVEVSGPRHRVTGELVEELVQNIVDDEIGLPTREGLPDLLDVFAFCHAEECEGP
jgi:hypothetical protein